MHLFSPDDFSSAVCFHFTYHTCMCVLHHCEVMMNGRPTKRRRWREKGRGKVISPLPFYRSISSWKSPHLLWELLHSSLIVTSKTHFLSATVCVCVCRCECHRNGETSKKLTTCSLHMSSCINELKLHMLTTANNLTIIVQLFEQCCWFTVKSRTKNEHLLFVYNQKQRKSMWLGTLILLSPSLW